MKSDAQIQKDVLEQLNWEPSVSPKNISVIVKNGIVTLSGMVESYKQKVIAENSARKIAGVKAVVENIQIAPYFTKTDTQIAEAVVATLAWHTTVNEEKIKIKVEHGVVNLEGVVEWEYQRYAVKKAIENLPGIRSINNWITIKPKEIKTADIKEKISAAFMRSAAIDAGRVNVEVIGSKVILKGTVSSFGEKEEAESAAWFAPGVTSVDNKLEVYQEEFVL